MWFGISSSRYPAASFAAIFAMGNPVAFDASALDRETRGFISIRTMPASEGSTATRTFDPPVSRPAAPPAAELGRPARQGAPAPPAPRPSLRHRRGAPRPGERRPRLLQRRDESPPLLVALDRLQAGHDQPAPLRLEPAGLRQGHGH